MNAAAVGISVSAVIGTLLLIAVMIRSVALPAFRRRNDLF